MHNADSIHGPSVSGDLLNLPHLLEGHWLVTLVFQIERFPALAVVAHDAVKHHHGSVFRLLELTYHRLDQDRGTNDPDRIPASGAPANRREESQFVSFIDCCAPVGKLLIHRDQQALSKSLDLGILGTQAIPNVSNGEQLLSSNHNAIVPHQFPESRKQKDFNVHDFPLEGIAGAGVKANRSTAIAGGEGSKFAKGMVDFGLT